MQLIVNRRPYFLWTCCSDYVIPFLSTLTRRSVAFRLAFVEEEEVETPLLSTQKEADALISPLLEPVVDDTSVPAAIEPAILTGNEASVPLFSTPEDTVPCYSPPPEIAVTAISPVLDPVLDDTPVPDVTEPAYCSMLAVLMPSSRVLRLLCQTLLGPSSPAKQTPRHEHRHNDGYERGNGTNLFETDNCICDSYKDIRASPSQRPKHCN